MKNALPDKAASMYLARQFKLVKVTYIAMEATRNNRLNIPMLDISLSPRGIA